MKNSFDGVFEDAPIFLLGAEECDLGSFPLNGVANGAHEEMAVYVALNKIILGSLVHRLEG